MKKQGFKCLVIIQLEVELKKENGEITVTTAQKQELNYPQLKNDGHDIFCETFVIQGQVGNESENLCRHQDNTVLSDRLDW